MHTWQALLRAKAAADSTASTALTVLQGHSALQWHLAAQRPGSCHGAWSTHGTLGCSAWPASSSSPSSQCGRWRHSSTLAGQDRMLLRDFIQQSLYHPELGYFSRPVPPVARLPEPINFRGIIGQAEYHLQLSRLYRQLGVEWLTPVEIFRPWYGRILARYMLEFRRHSLGERQPLSVIEIGGGTGTLAASILDYVREKAPDVYRAMTYTTIEISAPLAALQQRTVVHEAGHGGIFTVVSGDAADVGAWEAVPWRLPWQEEQAKQRRQRQQQQQQQQQWQHEEREQRRAAHCFVLAMEVLDNLPHDRVVRQGSGQPWQQTLIERAEQPSLLPTQPQSPTPPAAAGAAAGGAAAAANGPWREVLAPVDDPLIARCIEAVLVPQERRSRGGSRPAWLQRLLDFAMDSAEQARANTAFLPTACLRLLDALHTARPNHTLLAADFDALPDTTIPGSSAPLVSSRAPHSGAPADHATILVPWGSADIFFPSDFGALGALYAESAAKAAAAQQQQQQQQQQRRHQQQQQQQQHGTAPAAAGASNGTASADGSSGSSSSAGLQTVQTVEPAAAGAKVSVAHMPTAEFMVGFPESKSVRTLSGWNPLLQDWPNTRIFIGSAGAAAAASHPAKGKQ